MVVASDYFYLYEKQGDDDFVECSRSYYTLYCTIFPYSTIDSNFVLCILT